MSKSNEKITMHGNALKVSGPAIKEGQPLPSFKLTANDMSDFDNSNITGKIAVLVVMPSIDTPVCSIEGKKFDKEASELSSDVKVLVVTRDLPFAQKRWCGAEGASRKRGVRLAQRRSCGQFRSLISIGGDWRTPPSGTGGFSGSSSTAGSAWLRICQVQPGCRWAS